MLRGRVESVESVQGCLKLRMLGDCVEGGMREKEDLSGCYLQEKRCKKQLMIRTHDRVVGNRGFLAG
jgi:hypothetical protein